MANGQLQLLYFAWVRERVGVGSETVSLPERVRQGRISDLVEWLRTREARYKTAFAEPASIRIAVDQEMADYETPVANAREVAFFPPITGG